jgi:hypothetical protein
VQLERMKSFETPTWKRHFARVDALLEQLADSKVLRG